MTWKVAAIGTCLKLLCSCNCWAGTNTIWLSEITELIITWSSLSLLRYNRSIILAGAGLISGSGKSNKFKLFKADKSSHAHFTATLQITMFHYQHMTSLWSKSYWNITNCTFKLKLSLHLVISLQQTNIKWLTEHWSSAKRNTTTVSRNILKNMEKENTESPDLRSSDVEKKSTS